MTTPRLGAPELTAGQAAPESTVNEQVRYLEQGAGHFSIKDRDLAAPPGSPADGDCYIVAASPTGAWSGQAGKIAFYMNTGWEFIAVKEGMAFWIEDENALLVATSGSTFSNVGGTNRPIAFFFTTTPTASEILCLYTACEAITFADDFAGSVGDCGTNPTASFALDVQKNGSSVGTITISTAGALTFTTTGTTVSLAAGDQLKIVAPATADDTVADVSITLKGAL